VQILHCKLFDSYMDPVEIQKYSFSPQR
jgi:hypothetical protein